MANKIYPVFLVRRLTGVSTEDLSSGAVDIKAVFVDLGAYTYDDAHEFLSDIPAPARIATSANLASKTVVRNGDDVEVDCADFDIVIPASQPSIEAIVFYIDSGSAATSRLIRFADTLAELPFTPAAGGETRQIRPAATGWFRLVNP